MDFILQAIDRVDSLVTFTLVGFLQQAATKVLGSDELIVVSLFGSVALWGEAIRGLGTTLRLALQQIFALSLAQTLITRLAPSDRVTPWEAMHFVIMAFGIVAMLGSLPQTIRDHPNAAQFMGLVLFMFAEATQFVTVDQEMNYVLPPVGLLIVVSLRAVRFRNPALRYVVQGVNMFFVNAIITSLFGLVPTDYLQVFWLAALTIIVAEVNEQMPETMQPVSDYTTWKASHIISGFLAAYHSDTMLLIGLTSVGLTVGIRGLNPLCMVIAVKAVVYLLQEAFQFFTGIDLVLPLFAMVAILKTGLYAIKQWKK